MKNLYENELKEDRKMKTVYVNGKKAKLHGFTLRPISGMEIAETFGKVEYMDGTTDMVHSKRVKFHL